MDVVQLERFLRIASTGSFRAAARSLSLSQAALSFSMQQLEAELEGRLGRKRFAAMRDGLQSDWGALPEVEPVPEPPVPPLRRSKRRTG